MSDRKKRGRGRSTTSEPPRADAPEGEGTLQPGDGDTVSEKGSEPSEPSEHETRATKHEVAEISGDHAASESESEEPSDASGETAAIDESGEHPSEGAFATERPPADPNATTGEFTPNFDEEPRDGTLRGMRIADLIGQDPEMTVNLTGDPEMTVNLTGELRDSRHPRDFPLRDDAAEAAFAEGVGFEEPPASSETSDVLEEGAGDEGDDLGDAPTPLDATDVARNHLKGLLEALIFVSDAPIKPHELAKNASAQLKDVKQLLMDLKGEYAARGIQLDEVAGGWIFRTSAAYAPFVRDLTKQKPVKLTRAQIETLAIMAYRQPITRPEIDEIRGVDSGPVLKLLLERDLVKILGKKDEPGRPILYGTTGNFLEFFGLKSLKDLPTLREFTELNEDSRRVVEKELGEELEGAQEAAAPGEAAKDEAGAPVDRSAFEDPPLEENAESAAGDALREESNAEEAHVAGEGSVQDTLRPARVEEEDAHEGAAHEDGADASDAHEAAEKPAEHTRFDEDANTATDHGVAHEAPSDHDVAADEENDEDENDEDDEDANDDDANDE